MPDNDFERGFAEGFKAGFDAGRSSVITPAPAIPISPLFPSARMDKCGCPVGGVCLNAACPHRTIVIASVSQ